MDNNLDFYRRQITLTRVDAEMAKSSLSSTLLQLKLCEGALQAALEENERLRSQANYLEAQMQNISARFNEFKVNFKQVAVEELVKSLIDAIESGSKWDGNLAIANASVDIRVAMQVSKSGASVLVESPGVYPVEALSTISFDLKASPPRLAEELQQRTVADVKSAVLSLQAALDRNLPDELRESADAVIAKAGEFIADSNIDTRSIEVSLRGLVKSISLLSQRLQMIGPSAKNLTKIHSALPSEPSSQNLEMLARAIGDIAHSLRGEV
jgi:predicted Zn-dependent protease with MMP-like domain